MNWFDLLLLSIIGFYVIAGLIRGVLKQLFRLLGFFVVFALAFLGTPYLTAAAAVPLHLFGLDDPDKLLPSLLQPENMAESGEGAPSLRELLPLEQLSGLVVTATVFLVLLLVLAAAFWLLLRSLDKVNKMPVIGTLNRLSGGVVGLFTALLICFVLINLAALLPLAPIVEGVNGSLIAGYLKIYLPQLFAGFEEKMILHFLRSPAGSGA